MKKELESQHKHGWSRGRQSEYWTNATDQLEDAAKAIRATAEGYKPPAKSKAKSKAKQRRGAAATRIRQRPILVSPASV